VKKSFSHQHGKLLSHNTNRYFIESELNLPAAAAAAPNICQWSEDNGGNKLIDVRQHECTINFQFHIHDIPSLGSQ
jgi:hypothetical protein